MDNEKRIAYIFREEKVFLTKDGRFFGFVYDGQSVKCRKLSEKEKFCFLAQREKKKQALKKEWLKANPWSQIGQNIKKPLWPDGVWQR